MRCALVAVLGIAAWSLSYGGVSADTPEGSFCKAVKPCFREHSRRGAMPKPILALLRSSRITQNLRSSRQRDERGFIPVPEDRFQRIGPREISHWPDPTIVVVTPSCVVELAYVRVPSWPSNS